MSDWDFLHDMHYAGYNPDQIADAAACGYNPWEWGPDYEDDEEFSASCPQGDPELALIFEGLVENARSYHELTGRYLQIWGELESYMLKSDMALSVTNHTPEVQMASLETILLK